MRILHMSVHYTLQPGIFQQMLDEYRAAATLPPELRWDTRVFAALSPREGPHLTRLAAAASGGRLARLRQYLHIRRLAFAWLRQQASQYDWVLVRHGLADVFEEWASRDIGNWLSVHHTWEPAEALLLPGWKGRFFHALERGAGDRILGRARGIVGVTDELGRLEAERLRQPPPVFRFPNGVRLEDVPLLADDRQGPPRLVFVSSVFVPWHGLEKVIRALRPLADEFVLDIIGQPWPGQRELAGDDPRFVFHGLLPPPAIPPLLARADVGLGSFDLQQKGMSEACTLKVREYLANGLPVYAGHRDTALADDFPYFRQDPACEGAALLAYARRMRGVARATAREAAAPFIDKRACMLRLAADLATLPRADR